MLELVVVHALQPPRRRLAEMRTPHAVEINAALLFLEATIITVTTIMN